MKLLGQSDTFSAKFSHLILVGFSPKRFFTVVLTFIGYVLHYGSYIRN